MATRLRTGTILILAGLFGGLALAQQDRITSRIDGIQKVPIARSIHLDARADNDIGPADAAMSIENVTLLLKPSADRRKALDELLAAQQDPNSPEYHRWLTPEQYADRFGASQSDILKISAWLQSQGLRVDQTARGRNWILFSGTNAQMQAAFNVEIHRYRVDGAIHFANANDVSIPAALGGIVAGIRGLDDFRMKPSAPKRMIQQPDFNSAGGAHYLVPDDIAAIYGINALYGNGIDGTGQKIVIAGQSELNAGVGGGYPDLDGFRSTYNLPANTPQLVLFGSSPGIVSGDIDESNLDLEWAGAVARNATLIFVYAKNVLNSVQHAIDQNLAPIISFSYGDCEQRGSTAFQVIAQQANVQGITWVASAGDSGAAACDNQSSNINTATQGVAVSFPASIPEVTGIGGTTFSEGDGTYWSATNGPNSGSALSYIPETAWNDTPAVGFLDGTGGGASILFAKPVWQVGPGVPGDGARDVPDISLASSPQHDGYQVYSNGKTSVFGGTSAATPLFAGMLALLNQSLMARGVIGQAGLGNINPTLYQMASTTTGVFHDVISGNNIVPCQAGTTNCTTGSYGYSAGPGYDQVTGLGSVDANALISQWTVPASAPSSIVISGNPNPVYQSVSSTGRVQWSIAITLSETGGGATTLTGFSFAGTDLTSQITTFFKKLTVQPLGSITGNVVISNFTAPQTVALAFTGKDTNGTTWSRQILVPFLGAAPAGPQITGLTNGASFQQVYAPGMILSVFGTQLSSGTQAAAALPLPGLMQSASAKINGVVAPLYYVSPGQLNIQIPYETQPGPATLTLTSNGQTTTSSFTVTASAPGIFAGTGNVLVPNASGKLGDTLLLFMTGDGALSPFLSDGATPPASTPLSQLPRPAAAVGVTVGGVPAALPLAFVGVPSGLAGVTQINFVVPAGVPAGTQPVVVTVGGVASPAVNVTIAP
jgi:uncharacterized protein (TIGR03437 family)